ncbi:MAG: glycerol kinase GlpK [Trueperaceae bacterium]|nr:glycerol kinase GlpK [Trueperaceae bacterium]
MKYIMALDQGTTSSRAIIFNKEGSIVAQAQREFQQIYPKPGWVEHDASEIWSSQSGIMAEAIASAQIASSDIAAVGITNQRETTVVWEKETGRPIHNAIVWQDRRTSKYIDALKDRGLEPTFQKRNGLVLDAYFSGSKLAWILDNVDGARARAEAGELAFGTIDSWLVNKLTNGKVHVTDVTNACRTMLFNIYDLAWDDMILDTLDIPKTMLPEVRSSSEIYGEVTQGVMRTGVPIAGMAGDQQAATFGQNCFAPGQGKNTYGTGCFMVMNTGSEPIASKNKLLTTIAWQIPGEVNYALEGSIFIGGAVVQWLRDSLGIIQKSSDVEALATSVADNGGVYMVPAFAGLGAPHWDQYARGAIVGMTRGTTSGHIARAALESIAYQSYDVIKAMEKDSGIELQELRVDGGASNNDLLMQFQADVLGVPVIRPKVTETTALGAAYLAGLAVGYWKSKDEIATIWEEDKRFEPNMTKTERQTLLEGWNDAVGRSKAWAKE